MSDTIEAQRRAAIQMIEAQNARPNTENLNRAMLHLARGDDNAAPPTFLFEQAMNRQVTSPSPAQARRAQQQQPAVTYGQAMAGQDDLRGQPDPGASTATVQTPPAAAGDTVINSAVAGATSPREAAARALEAKGLTGQLTPEQLDRLLARVPDSPPQAAPPSAEAQVSPEATSNWQTGAKLAGAGTLAALTALLTRGAVKPRAAAGAVPPPSAGGPSAIPRNSAQPAQPTITPATGPIDPPTGPQLRPGAVPQANPSTGLPVGAIPPGGSTPQEIAAHNQAVINALKMGPQPPPVGPHTAFNPAGGTRSFQEQVEAARRAATVGGKRPNSPVPPLGP